MKISPWPPSAELVVKMVPLVGPSKVAHTLDQSEGRLLGIVASPVWTTPYECNGCATDANGCIARSASSAARLVMWNGVCALASAPSAETWISSLTTCATPPIITLDSTLDSRDIAATIGAASAELLKAASTVRAPAIFPDANFHSDLR